jgi:hypothetical protein
MLISFRSLASIVGSLMLLGFATQARAEDYNCFKHHQPGCCFKVTVAGDATNTNSIDVCKSCSDQTTNPFASCSGHSCSASFDGTNTTFTFCPGDGCTPHQINGSDHFGFDGGGGAAPRVLSASWDCSSTGTLGGGGLGSSRSAASSSNFSTNLTNLGSPSYEIVCAIAALDRTAASHKPAAKKRKENARSDHSVRLLPVMQGPGSPDTNSNLLSVTTNQVQDATPLYFSVYVRGTQTPAQTTDPMEGAGLWIQQPYPSTQSPMFQIENNTQNPIWLNAVGIIISDSQRQIGDLNFPTMPPPDTNDPTNPTPFTPLPCLDGIELMPQGQPGSSVAIPLSCPSTTATQQIRRPEPAGLQ